MRWNFSILGIDLESQLGRTRGKELFLCNSFIYLQVGLNELPVVNKEFFMFGYAKFFLAERPTLRDLLAMHYVLEVGWRVYGNRTFSLNSSSTSWPFRKMAKSNPSSTSSRNGSLAAAYVILTLYSLQTGWRAEPSQLYSITRPRKGSCMVG